MFIVAALVSWFFFTGAAFSEDGEDVEVEVEVREVEPGTERPAELKPVGTAEPGSPWKFSPKGPLEWVCQHPFALTVLQFPAESAYILAPGESRLGYRIDLANNFFVHQSGNGLVQLDFESFRQTLSYRRGINDKLELAAFVPFQYNSSGFLDSIIESWHDFFGLPTGDRPNFPTNQYSYVVVTDNEFRVLGESDQFGLGDVTLTGKYFIRPEDKRWPALSARLGAKLPTGDAESQLGSGGFDFGFDFLAQKTYGNWILYGQTGYILTGGNDFGLDGNDLWEWSLAGEYQTSGRHSWIVQFHKTTNAYYTGVEDIDVDTVEFALGWKRYIGRNLLWEGGFSEDVIVDSAPDFAVFTQFTYEF